MNSKIAGTIGFHTHLLTDEYRKAIERPGIDPIEEDGFPLPAWTAEDHLAFTDPADTTRDFLNMMANAEG